MGGSGSPCLGPQCCWQKHGAMRDQNLLGNLGKCGAALPESLPPHFKESTSGIRQCGQLCCGLWLAQAWEELYEEACASGRGLVHRLAHVCLQKRGNAGALGNSMNLQVLFLPVLGTW